MPLQAVEHTIEVLALLSASPRLSLAKIAEALNVSKSAAFRIVSSLVEIGALVRSENSYLLSPMFIELGSRVRLDQTIGAACRPLLERLSKKYGENVHVAVLQGEDCLIAAYVPSLHSPSDGRGEGMTIPAHLGSSGKVLLAALDKAEAVKRLGSRPLLSKTGRSITESTRLLRELEQIRQRGFSVSVDENQQGVTSVAVPIFDLHGTCIAALGLSGRSSRFTERFQAELMRDLGALAAEITKTLFRLPKQARRARTGHVGSLKPLTGGVGRVSPEPSNPR
jgi:IclR family pca regulon transcriptional regulator